MVRHNTPISSSSLHQSSFPSTLAPVKSLSKISTFQSTLTITPGEAIDTYGVGRVVASGNPKFGKAYAGFYEICKPKKGEKVFVSAASGSVWELGWSICKSIRVTLLKEKLGFDDAFNYREETDFKSTLKSYFPYGIDIYFDNVGGDMQAAAGFLAGDFFNHFGDFLSTTCGLLRIGKIQALEDISNGVDSIPSAFIDLFTGQNIWKQIVKIVQE
ncbi:hypothetical protein F3Y22_tig00111640pilonHSYRG00077 [Hibiscus syriacus]|uniref:Alcohol dehydrogenase-like C-terminal domain-containing protein n=1 Tax=Hibiscus syriacus TaxID=106335 RepID=A0A6A2Y4Q7_HIBSY|nr:hypothetical protein F3Y22_tig00111640pilonHSYRG00077 [Hibiscus syriacus]